MQDAQWTKPTILRVCLGVGLLHNHQPVLMELTNCFLSVDEIVCLDVVSSLGGEVVTDAKVDSPPPRTLELLVARGLGLVQDPPKLRLQPKMIDWVSVLNSSGVYPHVQLVLLSWIPASQPARVRICAPHALSLGFLFTQGDLETNLFDLLQPSG